MMMTHPEMVAEQVRLLLERPRLDDPVYRQVQLEGSSWDRGTPYGSRAVDFAREFAVCLAGLEAPRVLCAGCGSGLEMEFFKKLGFAVEGFDLDPEKVRVAEYCGLRAKVGDLHDPPFSEGIYDAVFCSHTLEHALDRARACDRLARLLKPGGLLCIIVPLEPEFPRHNPSHTAWVTQPEDILARFQNWELLKQREHIDNERQVVLIMRKPHG